MFGPKTATTQDYQNSLADRSAVSLPGFLVAFPSKNYMSENQQIMQNTTSRSICACQNLWAIMSFSILRIVTRIEA